jgi:hypothetical protein
VKILPEDKMAPFVSIIIPTYNSEDTMKACLESKQKGWMNIAFLAPEFLQRLGGGTTYVSYVKYSIPGADGKTIHICKKPQMNADTTIIT